MAAIYDDIFKLIFPYENRFIFVQISLKFIPKCHSNIEPALV